MYGENTKYHVNPYIQGTTVPCDTEGFFLAFGNGKEGGGGGGEANGSIRAYLAAVNHAHA